MEETGKAQQTIILGTSDAWSTSHWSKRTSVLYYRLTDFRGSNGGNDKRSISKVRQEN